MSGTAIEAGLTLRPLGDKLLVRPLPLETVSKGGIMIPDSAERKPMFGVVVAAGPGRAGEAGQVLPMPVRPGQRIMYNRFAGVATRTMADEALIVMCVDDVLAIVDPDTAHCTCPVHNTPEISDLQDARRRLLEDYHGPIPDAPTTD